MQELKIGDRVRVAYSLGEQTVFASMREFDNMVTTIEGERYYKRGASSFKTYTLKGCTSRYGNDYEFLEEWLMPITEEVTE